jgi:acyl carrier protein
MQISPDPSPEFAARVIDMIAKQDETIDKKNISLTTTLKALNFDSFGAAALMFDLEEAFGVELSDEKIESVRDVNDVVVMLWRICEGRKASA